MHAFAQLGDNVGVPLAPEQLPPLEVLHINHVLDMDIDDVDALWQSNDVAMITDANMDTDM